MDTLPCLRSIIWHLRPTQIHWTRVNAETQPEGWWYNSASMLSSFSSSKIKRGPLKNINWKIGQNRAVFEIHINYKKIFEILTSPSIDSDPQFSSWFCRKLYHRRCITTFTCHALDYIFYVWIILQISGPKKIIFRFFYDVQWVYLKKHGHKKRFLRFESLNIYYEAWHLQKDLKK